MAGHCHLSDGARESHHSKAAVLELTKLHPLGLLGVLAEAQGVEGKISRLAVLRLIDDYFCGDDLRQGKPEQKLQHGSLLHHGVVCVQHRHALVDVSGDAEELRYDETDHSEHSNASMLRKGKFAKVNKLGYGGGAACHPFSP
jgi:hypothetical protein